MLPPTYPLKPGQFFLWNIEHQGTDRAHTMARVLYLGADPRDDGTGHDHAIYAVQGDPVKLAACWGSHFLASCTPDPGEAWASAEEVKALEFEAALGVQASIAPGCYPFLDDPALKAAHAALKAQELSV